MRIALGGAPVCVECITDSTLRVDVAGAVASAAVLVLFRWRDWFFGDGWCTWRFFELAVAVAVADFWFAVLGDVRWWLRWWLAWHVMTPGIGSGAAVWGCARRDF